MSSSAKDVFKTAKKPICIALLVIFSLFFFHQCTLLGALGPNTVWNCILLAVLFWAVLSGKLPRENTPTGGVIHDAVSWIFLAAVPFLHFLLVELLAVHSRDIVAKMLRLNLIFYYLAFLVLLLLFRKRAGRAVFCGTLLCAVAANVNCASWQFRTLPVLPWDVYSVGVAVSVLDNYEFTWTYNYLTAELGFLVLVAVGFRLAPKHYPHIAVHIPATCLSVGALVWFLFFMQTDTVFTKFGGYRYLFTPTVYYERNGTAAAFLSTLRYLNVKKPSGYSAAGVTEESAPYAETAGEQTTDDDTLPNVIVIMNEAFSDLRALGDYETNISLTPNIDALTENTVKGNLHVSVKGGNTANTEYEFLTGDTMAFLPASSIPYQQYIKSETPTLVTQLENLGYQTAAIHPYYATGWFRNTVYTYFGFDSMTFLEDLQPFYSNQVVRSYYSDDTLFRKIESMYEDKNDGQPLFLFAVTMQNHGSYDAEYDNFKPDVYVVGQEDNKRLSAYLSLIHKTDTAFGKLIDYFSEEDEKIVILMFGDHQPNDNVVSGLLAQIRGETITSAELDAPDRYITPYILWANYDITETEAEDISVNYLSTLLCKNAGIPLSGYQTFLAELSGDYPVITANTIIRADGEEYDQSYLSTEEAEESLLSVYRDFAYNHIFDKKNRLTEFFD